MTVISIVFGVPSTIIKVLFLGLEDLEIRGRVETIPTTGLSRFGQYTEKSHRDSNRFAVTQTPVRNYPLILV